MKTHLFQWIKTPSWTTTQPVERSTTCFECKKEKVFGGWQNACAHAPNNSNARLFSVAALLKEECNEVTRAYIMHEMPHRSSWNQPLIIVPDRVVHPQPRRRATGAEIRRTSAENCQSCAGWNTERAFLFPPATFNTHDGMQKLMREAHMWYSGIHLHGRIGFMFPKLHRWHRRSADTFDNQISCFFFFLKNERKWNKKKNF